MAIRKKLTHDMKTRERIQTSQIINRLTDHIHNKIELSSTQIRAAEILLKKTLPDLSSIEMVAEITQVDSKELTDQQLADIATGSSAGATEQANSQKQVH